MAAPAYQSSGSYNARLSGDAAGTPGAPASVAQGDILLLTIEDGGTDGTTTPPSVSGGTETWTQTPNTVQYAAGATRLFVYWARASQANPTMPGISAGVNHTFAVVHRFTGGTTSGNPWTGSEYSGGSNEAANPTIPGATTGGVDRLIVVICCTGYNGTSSTRFSAWTNADLGSLTERYDQTDTIGSGGGIGMATGTYGQGTYGSTTVTEAFAGHGYITIALSPSAGPQSITGIALSQAPSLPTGGVEKVGELSGVALSVTPSMPAGSITGGGTYSFPNFRVRSGDTVGLNTDSGWAGALNESVTIDAETFFRIRFEVYGGPSGVAKQFKLQFRRNEGTWTDVTIFTANTRSNMCDAVLSGQYANNDATTNILSGSPATFEAGAGLEAAITTPSITLVSEHTEYEFCLRIPISYGEANVQHGRNLDGDTFDFRIVESSGTPLDGGGNEPRITLNFPVGLLGGTVMESPKHSLAFDDNGVLYHWQEFAETSAWPLLLRSSDGGDSWTVANGGLGLPADTQSKDMESGDVVIVGDWMHMCATKGTDSTYHAYAMSSDATDPDEWVRKDEIVSTGDSPTDQAMSMAVRSDGTVIIIYSGGNGSHMYYRIRSVGGTWGSATEIDTEAVLFTDAWLVKGASDKVHFFYVDHTNGILYHRSFTSGDSMSAREQVATGMGTTTAYEKPIVGCVYYDDGGVETIMVVYGKAATGYLYSSTVLDDGTPGNEQQATSVACRVSPAGAATQQYAADIALDGKRVYLLYADASTYDLWMDSNNDAAGWGTDTEVLDNVTVDVLRGAIFTHSVGNGGKKVYGYVYDDTAGQTGGVKYREVELSSEQQVDGVVLSQAPSLPTGWLQKQPVGVALSVTPSLPTGRTDHALGGVALSITPSVPIARVDHSLAGVARSVVPTMPAATLRTNLTGFALAVPPSVPSGGRVDLSVAGVALAQAPSAPAGRLMPHPVGVALEVTPSLPAGSLSTGGAPQQVDGVVLSVTPSLPVGSYTRALLAPDHRNLLSLQNQSDVEDGTTNGFTASGADTVASVTSPVYEGLRALRVITSTMWTQHTLNIGPLGGTGIGNCAKVGGGRQVTFSFYAKGAVGGERLYGSIVAKRGNGTSPGSASEAFDFTTEWARYSVTYTVPDSTQWVAVGLFTDWTDVSLTYYIDAVQLEYAATPSAFVHATIPSLAWTPTATLRHELTGIALAQVPTLPVGATSRPVGGVALSVTPSLPVGQVATALTGVALSQTPTLPVGQTGHSLTGVALAQVPTLPAGGILPLVGVALGVTPSLPAGSLQVLGSIIGVALQVYPTLPAAIRFDRTVAGVAIAQAPSVPAGRLDRALTGVAKAQVPTLPVGSLTVSQQVTGIALSVVPTLPAGGFAFGLVGVALSQPPSLPVGTAMMSATVLGVALSVPPTLTVGIAAHVTKGTMQVVIAPTARAVATVAPTASATESPVAETSRAQATTT